MSLARDVEAIERQVWADMYAAAPEVFRSAAGVDHRRFDGALAVVAAKIPDTQFNRAFGFGVDAPAGERELDDVIAYMRAAAAPRWWLQPPPEARDLIAAIEARGFKASPRPWAKLARDLTAPLAKVESTLSIAVIGAEQGDAFSAIACAGFGAPPILGAWFKALIGRRHWRLYLASDGATPISVAALWCDGEAGWYGIAATDPNARGRGGQSAVLARLMRDCRADGARLLIAETGMKQPGAVSTSFDNMIRQGFAVAHARANYAPPEIA
jgi:GNAT superfamily N-acetyltransferase